MTGAIRTSFFVVRVAWVSGERMCGFDRIGDSGTVIVMDDANVVVKNEKTVKTAKMVSDDISKRLTREREREEE